MVLNSGRKVFDLNRTSWSGDVRVAVPLAHIRLTGMYGAGRIRADYDRDDNGDLAYSGWEGRAVWNVSDFVGQFGHQALTFLARHRFEVGVRFDTYGSRVNDKREDETTQDNWTASFNYGYRDWLKVQVNYVWRQTQHPADPDLGDDILFVNFQGLF